MSKQRLSISISNELFNAIDRFSRSVGCTKSETIEQLMQPSIETLIKMANLHFKANTMTQEELEKLSSSLSQVSVFADGATNKVSSAVDKLSK